MINDWHVLRKHESALETEYIYDDNTLTQERLREEYDIDPTKYMEVPKAEWTGEDWAEILGNELEDRNHRWLVGAPKKLNDIFTKAELRPNQIRLIFAEIGKEMEGGGDDGQT